MGKKRCGKKVGDENRLWYNNGQNWVGYKIGVIYVKLEAGNVYGEIVGTRARFDEILAASYGGPYMSVCEIIKLIDDPTTSEDKLRLISEIINYEAERGW